MLLFASFYQAYLVHAAALCVVHILQSMLLAVLCMPTCLRLLLCDPTMLSLSKHLQVHCPASGTGAAVAEGVDVPLVAVHDTKVLKHQRNVWTVSHLSNLFGQCNKQCTKA